MGPSSFGGGWIDFGLGVLWPLDKLVMLAAVDLVLGLAEAVSAMVEASFDMARFSIGRCWRILWRQAVWIFLLIGCGSRVGRIWWSTC